jgi:hypothetical protein
LRIVSVITLALAAVALTAGTASAAGKSGFFKTQNNKIWCGWGYGGSGSPGFLVCGVKGGYLKPKPANNCKKFHVDYVGNRIAFANKGRATKQACAGDAGPFADPSRTKVLKAGKTWSGGGMSCKATTSTVRCKNKSSHGFELHSDGAYQIF